MQNCTIVIHNVTIKLWGIQVRFQQQTDRETADIFILQSCPYCYSTFHVKTCKEEVGTVEGE